MLGLVAEYHDRKEMHGNVVEDSFRVPDGGQLTQVHLGPSDGTVSALYESDQAGRDMDVFDVAATGGVVATFVQVPDAKGPRPYMDAVRALSPAKLARKAVRSWAREYPKLDALLQTGSPRDDARTCARFLRKASAEDLLMTCSGPTGLCRESAAIAGTCATLLLRCWPREATYHEHAALYALASTVLANGLHPLWARRLPVDAMHARADLLLRNMLAR